MRQRELPVEKLEAPVRRRATAGSAAPKTIREAARLVGVHANTIRRWVDRGILHAVHLPGSGYRRIPEQEIERIRAEMWRDIPTEQDPGVAPVDVPKGVYADVTDEDLPLVKQANR